MAGARRLLTALAGLVPCLLSAPGASAHPGSAPGPSPSDRPAISHARSYGCPPAPGEVQRTAPGPGRTVALTFDDGPGASTPQILHILEKAHVTATFFNLGANEAGDRTAPRTEQRQGFALGDHTWDHADLASLDASTQAHEIDSERAEQAHITGHDTCLFRPPYGTYDATTLQLARERGMAVWCWSVDTEDWKAGGSSDAYWVHRIASRARAGGAQQHPVVLMHNQPGGNPATVAALPRVISYYRSRGYTFVDLNGNTGRPSLSSVSRSTAAVAGGERVTVRGDNFRHVTAVRFGTTVAPAFTVLSAHRLVATVPRHAAGWAPIDVETSDHGTSTHTSAGRFHFVAPPRVTSVTPSAGPVAGGTRIELSGRNFVGVVGVRFGKKVVAPLRVVGARTLWVRTPPHHAGRVAVVVRTRYGTSAKPAGRRGGWFTFAASSTTAHLSRSRTQRGGERVRRFVPRSCAFRCTPVH